jgi:beta-N-acetylhexosaminidase
MRLFWVLLKLIAAFTCLVGAAFVRSPPLAELRPWLLWSMLGAATALALLSLGWRRWAARPFRFRADLAPFAVAIAALLANIGFEARFQLARRAVLTADPAVLAELSRHVIAGFETWPGIRRLVEQRAVGGVFITKRNVAGMDAPAIARKLAALQAIRTAQGLPRLWIATDQEGGGVSRMSPPLPRQPTLAAALAKLTGSAQTAAVSAYTATQARGLASLGVNLNFAPVVDLDHGTHNPNDAFTKIGTRVIAADPAVVSAVAGTYCDGMLAAGVRCTLKHFPGLGRVFEDTHRSEGVLKQSRVELEATDWVPFRRLLGPSSTAAVMVGHVRAPALDATEPVSTSALAINGLLRDAWGFDGLVVTDDMCMGAIYFGRPRFGFDNLPRASIRALNAGVDLLLITWDGEQVYPVLAAMLAARQTTGPDQLSAATLARSAARLQQAAATPR